MKRMTMDMLLHIGKVLERQVNRLIRDAQVQFFELLSSLCHGCLLPHSRCSTTIRQIEGKTEEEERRCRDSLRREGWKDRRSGVVVFGLADCSGR